MRKSYISLLMTVIASLAACATPIPVSDSAVTLEVGFEWPDISGCASASPSPAIKVSNIPEDTRYLRVTMVDLQNTAYRHGGGEVAFDGSGSIEAGALNDYEGPCPPSGSHTYEIRVQALNANRDLVLGQGKFGRRYPR